MPIRLVVGLGNADEAYTDTPHNIGFETLDALARQERLDWQNVKGKVLSTVWSSSHENPERIRLIKPLSYMNVSGDSVQWALHYWDIPSTDILVVVDDFSIPEGQLRLRRAGRSGGHNGLQSIIDVLQTTDFARLRIGIGPVPERMDPKDFVLKRRPRSTMERWALRSTEALRATLSDGLDQAMNRFNTASPEN
ncbi:MAG TPA: aminoacyl-tRNA hydrolase [Elusimicrobiota bacterium]|nr:aminoacyl-tRNA hydrolase [Elusimicrobiota bacterium]